MCEYCGKVAGQPHSIGGDVFLKKAKPGEHPDPEAKGHQHGDNREDQFDPRKDPLFLEWVYLVRPSSSDHPLPTIEVWKSVATKERNRALASTGVSRAGYKGGTPYTHVLVAVWDLNAEQAPDFQNCEAEGEVGRYAAKYREKEG